MVLNKKQQIWKIDTTGIMILGEAAIIKAITVNYALAQLDIGLENGIYLDSYFITKSAANGLKTQIGKLK